jgi:hypothetical protein
MGMRMRGISRCECDDKELASLGFVESGSSFADGRELGKTMLTSALKDTADRVLLGGND